MTKTGSGQPPGLKKYAWLMLLLILCGVQPQARAAWNGQSAFRACVRVLKGTSNQTEKREPTPHESFVAQQIQSNRIFPQMNMGIETQMLSFVLQNSGAHLKPMFEPMTEADVAAIGEAMNRVHQAMRINRRHASRNPFHFSVTTERLLGMLQGVRRTAAKNLDRTLSFLYSNYSPLVGPLGAVSDENANQVAARVESFLAENPGSADRVHKMGDAMAEALKDPDVQETAKRYRLGLQHAKDYTGSKASAYDVYQALSQALRREIAGSFPTLNQQQINEYLRATLGILSVGTR